MIIDKKLMGKRLKQEMKNCGYTQKQLSDFTGVSIQSVNSWVNGKSVPHPDQQKRLAELFKVRKAYLFGGSDFKDYSTLYLEKNKTEKEKKEIITAFITCCGLDLTEKTDNYIIVSDPEKQKFKLTYSEMDILIKDYESIFRNRLKSVFIE